MAKRFGPRSPRSPMATATAVAPENVAASKVFDQFCTANTFQAITGTFHQMCDLLEIRPNEHRPFYRLLKTRLTSWKAQSLWAKLDKRAAHREYKKSGAASNTRVLVIGCGPCGLRTAIEVALLGGKVVIVEKRDRFSRNNVLHLWPFLIHDLKAFGAKKFFGKFCAGAIDHISIRTLQCILLKIALLVGVEVHGGVGFMHLAEPDQDSSEGCGWRAKLEPADHPVSEYEFDVLVGADGKRNTLQGFKRKEFRGKLAIAITANFINRNTQLEARVEEISGVAYIFNQKFFKDLNQKTGIDLENIVYYKDETHYFVMTAKKHSLLSKGVLRQDYDDPAKLLARENVDQEELMNYAREAADVSTNHMLPHLDFAHNHYGLPDVAMFDFTSMFAAEHASRIIEKHEKRLLVCLVGDSLLEPFWPTGSGCARGFLSALDTAWMIRSWTSGKVTPLELMAERESIYQLLSQTTPENLSKNFSQYTIDPLTRYRHVNTKFLKPFQVRNQYEGVDQNFLDQIIQLSELKSKRYEWMRDSHYLQKWFQKQLEPYKNLVKIQDLTTSFRNGVALSALIHKYRPELLDISSLDANKVAENNQKVFDLAHKEFGISAVFTGEEMASREVPDKLTMTSYLAQFFEYFRKESIRPAKMAKTPEGLQVPQSNLPRPKSPSSRLLFLNKVSQRIRQKRIKYIKTIPIWSSSSSEDLCRPDDDDMEKENDSLKRQRKPGNSYLARKKMREEEEDFFMENYRRLEKETTGGIRDPSKYDLMKKQIKEAKANVAVGVRGQNKVSALAHDLARQFSGEAEAPQKQNKASRLIMGQAVPAEVCHFCGDKVYVVERQTAEGLFFHRGCLKCDYCGSGLRLGGYAFQRTESGEAKFFCFQHHGMSRLPTRTRKRSFGDKDLVKKLIPVISPEKPPIVPNVPPDKPNLSTPAASESGRLRPPSIRPPDNIDGDKNKTPERIEFEPESEYEESELEQTAHNLSSSLLEVDEEGDSDSDSEEDEGDWSGDDLSDADRSWADLARSYSKQLKKRLKREDREYGDDSDSDTPTIGASDADYETDTETEEYEHGRSSLGMRRGDIPALKLTTPKDAPSTPSHQKDAKSPASEEIKQNRLSFFSAPSQPVRIDPWSFLGLAKSPEPPTLGDGDKDNGDMKQEMELVEEEEVIEFDKDEVLAQDLSFSESSSGGEELPFDEVQALQDEYIRCLAEELASQTSSGSEGRERAELGHLDMEEMGLGVAETEEYIGDNRTEFNEESANIDMAAFTPELTPEDPIVKPENIYSATSVSRTERDRIQSSEFDMSEEELQRRREEKRRLMNRSDEVISGLAGVRQLSLPVVCVEEDSADATSLLDVETALSTNIVPESSSDGEGTNKGNKDALSSDSDKDIYTVDDLIRCGLIKDKAVVSKTQSELNLSPSSSADFKQVLASSLSSSHLPTTKATTSHVQNSLASQSEREPRSPRDQQEVQKNRFSFFDSPSEPVRIDAGSFFGKKVGAKNGSSIQQAETDNIASVGDPETCISPTDLSGIPESIGQVDRVASDTKKESQVGDKVESEITQKDVKSAVTCDNRVSVVENNEIAQKQHKSEDVCDSLSETQIMVLENEKEFNETLTEDTDLSALVAENANQLSSNDTLLVQNTESIATNQPLEVSPENLTTGITRTVGKDVNNQTLTETFERENSSSSESDTKFDTIKRKKQGSNKTQPKRTDTPYSKKEQPEVLASEMSGVIQDNIQGSGMVKSESSDLTSDSSRRRDSEDKSGMAMTSSFYSEGTSSHISHIADHAPLASLELDMEMTSGTETDMDQQTPCLTRKTMNVSDNGELSTPHVSKSGTSSAEGTGPNDLDRSKSELEQDAIRRIDELLLSYEQSKETKIDFPMDDSRQPKSDKTDSITKWLRETINPTISPISKPTGDDIELGNSKVTDRSNNDSASLPYESFNTEQSCSLEYQSFDTPNAADAAFINSIGKGDESLIIRETDIGVPPDTSTGKPNTVDIDDIAVRETDILNDSFGSVEDRLKSSIQDQESSYVAAEEANTSIVEFHVSDNEGDHSFQVDEKFVNVREKRKKKTKVPQSPSSEFTISTPSGSVESTSTAAELQSNQQSSVPLTASTTADSFSAVKMSALLSDEDNLSFGDIALAYQRDNISTSLEKLANENEGSSGEVTSANDLSSLDKEDNAGMHFSDKEKEESSVMLSSRSEPMDIPSFSHCKSEALDTETNTLKAEDDLVFSFDNDTDLIDGHSDQNSSIPLLSTSAPSRVHSFQLYNNSYETNGALMNGFEETTSKTQDKRRTVTSSATDDSFYYTPDVSGIEPMDITDENGTPKSPAPSTRTVKSDSTILDDRRTELRRSDQGDLSQSPTSSIVDAKRRFFCETSQPVRIDHYSIFNKEKKIKSSTPECIGTVKGWKSLDTPTSTSISPAVPRSNVVVGDSEKFFTPATSVKSKPILSGEDVDFEGFRRPTEVSRKIISEEVGVRSGKSVARELSLEEKKKMFDQEREKARQEARERARMLSDEELGVKQAYTPRKGSFKETKAPSAPESKTEASEVRPMSAKTYTSQVSKESGASIGKSDASDPSPSSGRKGKGIRMFQKTQKSPNIEKKGKKKKADDEEKENKEQQDGNKKEKRKSLLQKLLPSKNVEKKEKASTKSPVLPTAYNGDRATPSSSAEGAGSAGTRGRMATGHSRQAESESKSKGIVFRSKKSKSLERERKALSMEEGKRESLYRELAPMFHQVLGGPDGQQSVSAVKAKIETVAPPPAKAPHTVLEPPRATEDFDTESEFGDTTSLRSYQEPTNGAPLTEEELGKVIRKQQKAAKKRQREQELRRLHTAQEIQRQLEEVEVKQREIEQRGVIIERALRGDGPDAKRDESQLMQDWFNIVHEKNVLVRYESELMVHARELELEDRHARLEQQLRDRMSIDDVETGPCGRRDEERQILQELVEVVEQRDALVGLLEEDRQREREQEQGLKKIMSAKGFQLSPITYANRMRLPSLGDMHRDTR